MSRLFVHGTDGCRSCETGRITLFAHTTCCIQCAPEDYTREVTPADEEKERLINDLREAWNKQIGVGAIILKLLGLPEGATSGQD